MIGARPGNMTVLQRLVAAAMSRDLCGFVVPGVDVARAAGLDLGAAGLHLSATPRHAGLLVVLGPLSEGLAEAASIAYGQMPRPRAILALGADDLAPLPDADATGPLTQAGLVAAMDDVRDIIANGAFRPDVEDFAPAALQTRTQYTCPMHPEIVEDEPGNCPKCGMTLVPRETAAPVHSGHAMHDKEHEPPAEAPDGKTCTDHGHAMAEQTGHGDSHGQGHSHSHNHNHSGHSGHDHAHHAGAQAPAQYTCPMHPEVISDQPGSCPECGMHLVPVEAQEDHTGHTGHSGHSGHSGHDHAHQAAAAEAPAQYTCPMHPEVISDQPGSCPECGMHLVPVEAQEDHANHSGHSGHDHAHHAGAQAPAQYTCPMHPEVISEEPGSCPECGMHLVPVEEKSGHDGHASHARQSGGHGDHGGHAGHAMQGEPVDGIEAHFMSMVDLTRDMPASADGLKMEWVDVPFGPFFPGLPGGLQLDLTLDGDAVVAVRAGSAVGTREALYDDAALPGAFVDRLAALSPLSPVAYRLLACLALEKAAGQSVKTGIARARIAAVERERMASHFGWLAGVGAQSGFGWLDKRAAALQMQLRAATHAEIAGLAPDISAVLARLQRTPLLNDKLKGIGRLTGDHVMSGPVARAAGTARDARSDDPVYAELGFAVLTQAGGDALARLTQRCGEILQSLELVARAGAIALPEPHPIGAASGAGEAVVETPRGAARLNLTLQKGKVATAEIETPGAAGIALIAPVAEGRELGDALTGIGSLDISPWEVTG